ncbi:toll/interleukin-1 receptor domain-containing protein [Zoogloea dura]|uniref:Toll/interleukin-1 receptor domain-containing protein n=1 Tax=Zoogloea dura TaxID=2728840 RepID=A0A848G1F3_9RHOO|nr:toll/interleukin-1 receptor domain-containing protein [Zoogloea dura]NML25052.1 toll/interleukin-1 receptor domain-containing protein [Zoogloea dura]
MPYPAALGHRPLEVDEAYAALTQYAADYGREPLLLLMHAAVPETLRPDLLNLIRVNFLAARGPDTSLEADVLFSPLATALGGGYYRIDAQVRWHCLVMLRSLYRHDPRPRIRRIAELLWRYVEAREHQASRAADPQLAEFLDIQRWVALAFLEPGSAAHAFADALRQAGDSRSEVTLRLGGLAAAIEIPLAGQPELLAYARGLDALAGGNEEAGRQLLEALGDGDIRVGDIVLRPGELLADSAAPSLRPDTKGTPASRRICLVLAGRGSTRDPMDGSLIDFEALYPAITQGLARLDIASRRFDLPASDSIQILLDADLVLGDLSGADPDTCYQLGLALALRPEGVQLIARRDSWQGVDALALGLIHEYDAPESTPAGLARFAAWLAGSLQGPGTPLARSPVYLDLDLRPPHLDEDAIAQPLPAWPSRPQALLIQAHGLRVDPASGRSIDLDDSRASLGRALQGAGIDIRRADDDATPGSPDFLRQLLEADLVVADLSTLPPDTLLQLGLRHGLRPGRNLLLAEAETPLPISLRSQKVLRYKRVNTHLDTREQADLNAMLQAALVHLLAQTRADSPVYEALPALHPPSPRPARIFVSYPQTYTPYVRPLVAALKGLGLEVSWDMDLSSGHDWATALSRMLEEADAVICVAGRDTAAREFPMAEIQRSVELGKRLIPVLVEPIDAPPELTSRSAANPERNGRLRYLLDGWREDDFDALVAEIAERIRTRLGAPEQAPPADSNGQATRQLSIRVLRAGQLEVQCADESGRHDWRQAYDPAAVALAADTFQHQTPRTGQALDVLTDLLIPSALAGLPRASAYRLILGPEAVPWPWELMLSWRLHALRKAIPVLRRSDGNLFSVLREPPRRALLVHSRPQSEAPIRADGLDALQGAGFEVTISTGEPRETLLALTSGDFGLVIINGRSSAGDGRAGMLLGDGVALGSEDLAQMRLTPEVVILHAPEVDHGGLASLMAPALQKAGVRCVVAPAWGTGGPADAAYHDTLLSLLAGGERFADAHAGAVAACFDAAPQDGQWAAYQAWGEPDFRFPGLAPA